MPRSTVKEGATLTAGEDGYAGGSIAPGTSVTVAELGPGGEDGIGGTGDMAVIEWTVPALVQGDDGVELGEQLRRTSIPVADLGTYFGG